MLPAIALVSQGQEQRVDMELLRSHNVRSRLTSDCAADLILSKAGLTVPFVFLADPYAAPEDAVEAKRYDGNILAGGRS